MCPIPYYTMSRQFKDPKQIRYKMVRHAKEHGIKPAARTFSTTVKTVKKWLNRWVVGTMQGLEERSRAPHKPFRRINEQQRKQVIDLKLRLPSWGAARMKRNYDLKLSEKAIRKIWREEGLMKMKRRKHKTKNDLRAVKAQWKLFQQTCVDTKDLIDIPELWPSIQKGYAPKMQYTAREVVSGLQFIAFAEEKFLTYSNLFIQIILDHLKECGVELRDCRIQSDNGSEFIGNWMANENSIFTRSIEAVGMVHHTIPPGAHTYQADVETVHRIIEDEFYEVEKFTGRIDFLSKASAYNLWFNVARKNSYKGNKTPWEIIQQRNPTISPRVTSLPPVFLDQLLMKKLESNSERGYDLIPHPCYSYK